jgi:hypothetical protein
VVRHINYGLDANSLRKPRCGSAAVATVLTVLALLAIATPARAVALADDWCGMPRVFAPASERVSAPSIQVFVAHPSDVEIDAQAIAPQVQLAAKAAHEKVVSASLGTKGLRFRTAGGACSAAHVDIVEIVLGPRSSIPTLYAAHREIVRLVGQTPLLIWAGFVVGLEPSVGFGGSPSLTQSRPITPAQDAVLDGRGAAVISEIPVASPSGGQSRSFLHELFHVLGAVNDNALHAFENHINGQPGLYEPDLLGDGCALQDCSVDAGSDDYFNPQGEITGKNGIPIWNLYDSLYLCALDTCFQEPTPPQISLQMAPVDGQSGQFMATGAALYRWYLDGVFQPAWGGPSVRAPVRSIVGVRGFTADGAASGLVTKIATPTVTPASAKAKARITVRRARVRGGGLDVLAQITKSAAGLVRVSYRSAGRTTRFTTRIVKGRIRFERRLPSVQRRRGGILTLSYGGSKAVGQATVRRRVRAG